MEKPLRHLPALRIKPDRQQDGSNRTEQHEGRGRRGNPQREVLLHPAHQPFRPFPKKQSEAAAEEKQQDAIRTDYDGLRRRAPPPRTSRRPAPHPPHAKGDKRVSDSNERQKPAGPNFKSFPVLGPTYLHARKRPTQSVMRAMQRHPRADRHENCRRGQKKTKSPSPRPQQQRAQFFPASFSSVGHGQRRQARSDGKFRQALSARAPVPCDIRVTDAVRARFVFRGG